LPEKEIDMNTLKLASVGSLLAGVLMFPVNPAMADFKGKIPVGAHKGPAGLHIPPGHLPPPGLCRIWFPGRPPGHQPRPGNCRTLSLQVPRGALLISRERTWTYDQRPDRYYHGRHVNYGKPDWRGERRYPRGNYGRSYSEKREIREGIRDVRDAHKDVRRAQEELEKNREELRKDRTELRRDIRQGASPKEVRQDRREVRESAQKVAESEKKVQQSQRQLESARRELNRDLGRR
jgi:hypothetical protein